MTWRRAQRWPQWGAMNDAAPHSPAPTTVEPTRFRLALSPLSRWSRVVGLTLIGLLCVGLAAGDGVDALWRAVAVVGVVSSIVAVRIVVGPAVIVTPRHLRIHRAWPLRRDVPWYRLLEVEVVPVAWVLEVELNNGDRFELPAVEHLNELYHAIEEHRRALDG